MTPERVHSSECKCLAYGPELPGLAIAQYFYIWLEIQDLVSGYKIACFVWPWLNLPRNISRIFHATSALWKESAQKNFWWYVGPKFGSCGQSDQMWQDFAILAKFLSYGIIFSEK